MIGFDIKYAGPFFTGALSPKVERALDDTVQELMEKGEERLGQLLQKGGVYKSDGTSTGYYRQNIAGELQSNHSALLTDSGVVYGPWLEGTSSRNETTRFKGYSSFRKVRDWLDGEMPAVAIKHMTALVRKLD